MSEKEFLKDGLDNEKIIEHFSHMIGNEEFLNLKDYSKKTAIYIAAENKNPIITKVL